jgi:cell division transport system permease protein
MSKRKVDAKAFAQQRRKRRQFLTYVRMVRYGVNNFSRNAWLTIAATAVMTVTLTVVFVSVAAHNVLVDTVDDVRNKVDMSIYVKTDTDSKDVQLIKSHLEQLSSVKSVAYVSPEAARADFAQQNASNNSVLSALNEATNQLPGTFRIKVADINNTAQLEQFVKSDSTLKNHIDPSREPSFAGSRRSAIAGIGRVMSFTEKAGMAASILFIAISSLIVFNTIRMAIFNRKDEIQMMKLIGADRSFIRGPFIVEAVVYGIIAGVVASAIGVAALYGSSANLVSYGIVMRGTTDLMTTYGIVVIIGMMVMGAVIGVISSLLATQRYLKL